ncbi:MAG TPA: histidine--tRNA ligase [Gemmatimonadaceae bacterium]|nr:histidine--tRNA ligase [Gemmatimonadaceae bacterium]
MSSGSLPGFRDFFPETLAERSHIVRAWREVARRYGFVEYDGPPLEPLELYTRKSGEEIVDQLYTFTDRGGREVALRPEMTPTFARMVSARANALRKPVRWFSVPQLFRYERQQRGRLREHFQLNVDIVGEPGAAADAELLAVAIDIMRVLGLTAADVRARVSDRRLLQAMLQSRGVSAAAMPAAFAVIDKMEREPRAVGEEKLRAAGLQESAVQAVFRTLDYRDSAPRSGDGLVRLRADFAADADVTARVDELATYLGYLDALDVRDWVVFDPTIVRGLAYYTGIVFELFDARGELRAICGGGRYDDLLAAVGGADLPALGFGMGDVVLAELLRDRGLMPAAASGLDVWVAYDEPELLGVAMRVASLLRSRGCSVEYALRAQKLARQLKAAAAAGAARVVIIERAALGGAEPGAPSTLRDDLATRLRVTVRWLADGQEERMLLAELLDRGDCAATLAGAQHSRERDGSSDTEHSHTMTPARR